MAGPLIPLLAALGAGRVSRAPPASLGFSNSITIDAFGVGIDCRCGIFIQPNGDIDVVGAGTTVSPPNGTKVGTWGRPTSHWSIGDYDFRIDKQTGDSINYGPSNDEDTWIAGGGTWSLSQTVNGMRDGTWLMRMRPQGGGADIGSSSFVLTLSTEREP
jgi:hypothetical protein